MYEIKFDFPLLICLMSIEFVGQPKQPREEGRNVPSPTVGVVSGNFTG